MGRLIWKSFVVVAVLCTEVQPVRAATATSVPGRTEGRHSLVARKRHTVADSGMMLAFGVGLFGCASVCAVESHREERRRQAHAEEPGLGVALPV